MFMQHHEEPYERSETESERLDRNWGEILQELRVTQTGTQILTGFLLTLAFQPRFAELDAFQVGVYLTLLSAAVVTTTLALAPVSMHRALFRQRAKHQIVRTSNAVLKITLVMVALILTGTMLLIFDVVLGHTQGIIAAAVTLILTAVAWLVLPLATRPDRD